MPQTPVSKLTSHGAPVNAVQWAPHSSCHICTGAEDSQALIWDLSTIPNKIDGASTSCVTTGMLNATIISARTYTYTHTHVYVHACTAHIYMNTSGLAHSRTLAHAHKSTCKYRHRSLPSGSRCACGGQNQCWHTWLMVRSTSCAGRKLTRTGLQSLSKTVCKFCVCNL